MGDDAVDAELDDDDDDVEDLVSHPHPTGLQMRKLKTLQDLGEIKTVITSYRQMEISPTKGKF